MQMRHRSTKTPFQCVLVLVTNGDRLTAEKYTIRTPLLITWRHSVSRKRMKCRRKQTHFFNGKEQSEPPFEMKHSANTTLCHLRYNLKDVHVTCKIRALKYMYKCSYVHGNKKAELWWMMNYDIRVKIFVVVVLFCFIFCKISKKLLFSWDESQSIGNCIEWS